MSTVSRDCDNCGTDDDLGDCSLIPAGGDGINACCDGTNEEQSELRVVLEQNRYYLYLNRATPAPVSDGFYEIIV